jgi:hypothetical protein
MEATGGERRCARHPDAVAPHVCDRCGDFICDGCAVRSPEGTHCAECRAKAPVMTGIPAGTECRADAILARALECARAIALPATALGAIPFVVTNYWGEQFQELGLRVAFQPASLDAHRGALLGGLVVAGVLLTWLMLRVGAAILLMARAGLHGRRASIGETWREARGRPLPLFVGQLLIAGRVVVVAVTIALIGAAVGAGGSQLVALAVVTLAGAVGLLLLLVGWARWSVFSTAIVLERISGRRSIPRSVELTRGHLVLSFLLGVLPGVGAAVAIVGLSVGLYFLHLPAPISIAIQGLATLVSNVLTIVLDASLYYALRLAEADASAI